MTLDPDRPAALNLARSNDLLERALRVIPGGTSTNSKRVGAFGDAKMYPSHLVRAEGCRVEDVDGNIYIDFVAALAPIVLGYRNARVDARIRSQLDRGILFSLPSPDEVELAETLAEIIPCAEMVRILKTGAEATSAAIRAARLYTGRDMVACCGYHGWHDWYAATRWPEGIPNHVASLTKSFEFNDLAGAQELASAHAGKIACFMVTPAIYGSSPSPGFLEGLRALADETGAVLIFDEIITGFRWALGGAQQKYGVIPDLAVFAKGMANGMPIAALVGRNDMMAPLADNWITSTYASETLSIVAALETIAILRETDAIERLYANAILLADGLADISRRCNVELDISDPLPVLRFEFIVEDRKPLLNDLFIANCALNGVLIRRDGEGFSLCIMVAHSDIDIQIALSVFEVALLASVEAMIPS